MVEETKKKRDRIKYIKDRVSEYEKTKYCNTCERDLMMVEKDFGICNACRALVEFQNLQKNIEGVEERVKDLEIDESMNTQHSIKIQLQDVKRQLQNLRRENLIFRRNIEALEVRLKDLEKEVFL